MVPLLLNGFLGPLIEKVINLWYASGDRKPVDIGPKNKTDVTSGIPAEKLSAIHTGEAGGD